MEKAIRALDLVLVMGCAANILKAGDLLLREHQKRALARTLEHATLLLEYARPVNWLRPILEGWGGVTLTAVGGMIFLVTWLGSVLPDSWLVRLSHEWWPNWAPSSWSSGDVPSLVASVGVFFLFRKLMRNTNVILYFAVSIWRDTRLVRIALRLLVVAAIILLVDRGMVLLDRYVFTPLFPPHVWQLKHAHLLLPPDFCGPPEPDPPPPPLPPVFWNGETRFVYFGLAFVALIPGTLALLLGAVLLVASGIVRIATGVAWRVVEFSKGPVAALFLLLTILVGIADLYLRSKL